MKRHRVLEPFSRDHYEALVVARHLMQDRSEESLAACLKLWDIELLDHFQEEEKLLPNLATPELATKLKSDHESICQMVLLARVSQYQPDDIYSLGCKIHEHIRWEERVLFPVIEQALDIESIASETNAMESRRHLNSQRPLRAEQVDRRKSASNG